MGPRRRGGVVTQRPAKPCTPVRFRSSPSSPIPRSSPDAVTRHDLWNPRRSALQTHERPGAPGRSWERTVLPKSTYGFWPGLHDFVCANHSRAQRWRAGLKRRRAGRAGPPGPAERRRFLFAISIVRSVGRHGPRSMSDACAERSSLSSAAARPRRPRSSDARSAIAVMISAYSDGARRRRSRSRLITRS
jgi:hypothetical protein